MGHGDSGEFLFCSPFFTTMHHINLKNVKRQKCELFIRSIGEVATDNVSALSYVCITLECFSIIAFIKFFYETAEILSVTTHTIVLLFIPFNGCTLNIYIYTPNCSFAIAYSLVCKKGQPGNRNNNVRISAAHTIRWGRAFVRNKFGGWHTQPWLLSGNERTAAHVSVNRYRYVITSLSYVQQLLILVSSYTLCELNV